MPEMTIGCVASPAPERRWNPWARMSPVWRVPFGAWLLSRLLVLSVAVIGSAWLGWPPLAPDSGIPRPIALLGGWDTNWYLRIARNGYQTAPTGIATHHSDFVFYPLLPSIMHIGVLTSSNPFLWGLVASNAALLVGLIAFHGLTEDRTGLRFADRATWILAFSPAAVYASLAYTDGILLALATCAAWVAWRGRWWLAAGLSAISVLVRPQGFLVALLVVMIAVTAPSVPGRLKATRAGIAVTATLAAFLGFLAWMQVARGSWQLPFTGQQAWRRYPPGLRAAREFGTELKYVFTYPGSKPNLPWFRILYWTGPVRDLIISAVMFALLVALIRYERSWRSIWVIFTALALLVPLSSGNFSSETRFGLLAFPLIWPIAAWCQRGSVRRVRGLSVLGVILIAALVLQLKYAFP